MRLPASLLAALLNVFMFSVQPVAAQEQPLPATYDEIVSYNLTRSGIKWVPWSSAPEAVMKFLLAKDPTLPQAIGKGNNIYVAVRDLELDKKNDVILFYANSKFKCQYMGCPFSIYYGDSKKALSDDFYARKLNVSRRSFMVDNKPYHFKKPSEVIVSNLVLTLKPYPYGMVARIIQFAWKQVAEYNAYIKAFGEVPSHMVALADLNNDGTQEIFVRHYDEFSGFCDEKGIACRLHIYYYNNKNLIEIGRMMSAKRIIVSGMQTNGYHDILVEDPSGKMIPYKWDGQTYKEDKPNEK
jgi:hypothetical protein